MAERRSDLVNSTKLPFLHFRIGRQRGATVTI
jgi:hypothetical protein